MPLRLLTLMPIAAKRKAAVRFARYSVSEEIQPIRTVAVQGRGKFNGEE